MATISTLTARTISLGLVKFGVLFVLFFACFAYGGSLVAPALPANNPEPGPLPLMASLLIVTVSSALVVALIVLSSSWHGLKLMLTLALTYYVAVTFLILTNDPWLIPFQVLRALLWTACALPIIRGTRWPMWATAVVVGLMFSVPQNLGHLLPNDLLPINSVRLSHLVETASSTFVFGLIVTGLLYQGPALASEPGAQPGSLRHAQAST